MMKLEKRIILVPIALAAFVAGVVTASADEREDVAQRAVQAAEVLKTMFHAPDSEIPAKLLEQAHAVATIPNVVKGGFVVGGQWGKGPVAARDEDGHWGTPAYLELHGGSFGLQIGVEATDLILVFTKPEGLRELLKDNLKLGVEAGAVAGPVGRELGASSNFTFDSPIYAYSRNKGLFAGVALDGTVISIDDSANHEAFGREVSGTEIVIKGSVEPNDVTEPFVNALRTYLPGRDQT